MSKTSSSARAKRLAPPTQPPPEHPVETLAPATTPIGKPGDPKGKLGVLVAQLRRPGGVSLYDLACATHWQLHSVRGAMAGALKARGYAITSIKAGKGELRLYSLVEPAGEV